MIKAAIVREVAKKLDVKEKDALVVVDGIVESLKDVICEYRRLEVRDFGVFQVKNRKGRVGRNPRDKIEYPIPERQVLTFRVGKELKQHLEQTTEPAGAETP
ncbi:integration host factor subunit beta [bacterium]|nr:integration host factor subunit beta [bacterium]